jgi:hypothetical protein
MPTPQWTADQLAEARDWYKMDSTSNSNSKQSRRAQARYSKLESEMGETTWSALIDFVEAKNPVAEDEEDEADGVEEGPKIPGGYPALLPWPPEREGSPLAESGTLLFEDYDIDFRCIPHGARGRRKKRGPVTLNRYWLTPKGAPRVFICRYRLTGSDGKRRDIIPIHCAMARTLAEQIFKRKEEEL